jgi:hypothetical protein
MSMRPPITLPLLQRVAPLVAQPMERALDRASTAIDGALEFLEGSIDVLDQLGAAFKGKGLGGKTKGKGEDAAAAALKGRPPSSESKRNGKNKGKDKGKDKNAAQRSRSPPALRGIIALEGKGSPPALRGTIANEGKGNVKGDGKFYDLVANALRGPNANAAPIKGNNKGDKGKHFLIDNGECVPIYLPLRGTVAAHAAARAAAAPGNGDGKGKGVWADPAPVVYVPPGRAPSPPGQWSV